MTATLIVDAVIVAIILLALFSGWRQGAFSSILSAVGVLSGLVIGLAIAPFVIKLGDTALMRLILLVAVTVLFVGLGNLVGATIGGSVRDRMRTLSSQKVDSVIGAVMQALAAIVVVWLISIPLAANIPGDIGKGLRTSKILGGINKVAPDWSTQVPTQLSALLDESGLPPLVSPFEPAGNQEVDAPDANAIDMAVIEEARESIIHVRGDADECERRLMGSGFVAAEDYVITNAHVVAGTESVALDTVLGNMDATVVYYNPDVDIAVLHAPELGLKPLGWSEELAETGSDAIVMGFPASGPFEAAPARIRERITIAGPDIYATGRVEREAYTVRGTIRQGNSGGPMTDVDGRVIGVVFGASVDATDTGYALTSREVLDNIGDFTTLTKPVDTQKCAAR